MRRIRGTPHGLMVLLDIGNSVIRWKASVGAGGHGASRPDAEAQLGPQNSHFPPYREERRVRTVCSATEGVQMSVVQDQKSSSSVTGNERDDKIRTVSKKGKQPMWIASSFEKVTRYIRSPET